MVGTQKYLINHVANISNKIEGIEWYLFGSFLTNHVVISDIDLLIVYSNHRDPELIRSYFRNAELKLPLHFTFLTYEEELEFDFIKSVNAKRIFP